MISVERLRVIDVWDDRVWRGPPSLRRMVSPRERNLFSGARDVAVETGILIVRGAGRPVRNAEGVIGDVRVHRAGCVTGRWLRSDPGAALPIIAVVVV